MSGELRLSQFRWTTTADNDLVIGNPGDGGTSTKFLVFQTTNIPGYANNPHFRCEWSGSAWELKISQDGSTTIPMTGMAYLAANQTFTGNNTFSGTNIHSGTNTFSGDVVMNGGLAINGTLTSVNTVDLTVNDKLITLNKGGVGSSAAGSGLELEENTAVAGYMKTTADRLGWVLKAPAATGALTIKPIATDIILTAPPASGTIALAENTVTLNTDQTITGIKTFSSVAQFTNGANLGTTGQAIINNTGNATFVSVQALSGGSPGTISGNHLGLFSGHAVPANATGNTDDVLAIAAGGSLAWVSLTSKIFSGILLQDTANSDVYKLQITSGTLVAVLQ
jgi:hypothetical protein